jgi:hypothetical protein
LLAISATKIIVQRGEKFARLLLRVGCLNYYLFKRKAKQSAGWLVADAIYEVVSVCLSSGKLILSLAPLLLSASVKCIFSSGGAALLNFML